MDNIEAIFTGIGGRFVTPFAELHGQRLPQVKAYCFDWDGIFNDGQKNRDMESLFTEADSMGLNLLRFSHWLRHGVVPPTIIITGQENPLVVKLAQREHLHAVYFKAKNKVEAITHLGHAWQVAPAEVAFMFDDALDLSAAAVCGVRCLAQRSASPLFTEYVLQNGLCDYATAHTGGQHAVREVCELLMGLAGNYTDTVSQRVAYNDNYTTYLAQRNATVTAYYRKVGSDFTQVQVVAKQ